VTFSLFLFYNHCSQMGTNSWSIALGFTFVSIERFTILIIANCSFLGFHVQKFNFGAFFLHPQNFHSFLFYPKKVVHPQNNLMTPARSGKFSKNMQPRNTYSDQKTIIGMKNPVVSSQTLKR